MKNLIIISALVLLGMSACTPTPPGSGWKLENEQFVESRYKHITEEVKVDSTWHVLELFGIASWKYEYEECVVDSVFYPEYHLYNYIRLSDDGNFERCDIKEYDSFNHYRHENGFKVNKWKEKK